MKNKKIINSIRKFIRMEKGRIRRQFLDAAEQKKLIGDLYNKFSKPDVNPGNIRPSDK